MNIGSILKWFWICSISTVLVGCSGGGGSDSSTPTTNAAPGDTTVTEPKIIKTTVQFSGAVVDGYLTNAIVCLDLNKSRYCDLDSEPATTTDKNGAYSLDVTDYRDHANFSTAPILVFDGYDADTGERFEGKLFSPQGASFQTGADETKLEKTVNVTAITTLYSKLVESGETLENASKQVKTALNIPENIDIGADPIQLIKDKVAGATEFVGTNIALNRSIKTMVAAASQDTNLKANSSQVSDTVFSALAKTIKSSQSATETKTVEALVSKLATDTEAKKELNSTVLEKAATVAAVTAKKTTEIYKTTINTVAEAQAAAMNASKMEQATSALVKADENNQTAVKLDDTFVVDTVKVQAEQEAEKVVLITANDLALEFLTLAGINLNDIEKTALAGLVDLAKQSPFSLTGLKTYISATANYANSPALQSVVSKIDSVIKAQNTEQLPESPTVVAGRDIVTRATTSNAAQIAQHCPVSGGIQLDVGIDINANGLLEDSEIDPNRTQYICHGKDGVDGKDGVSVVGSSVNTAGELELNLSDNTTLNAGQIVTNAGGTTGVASAILTSTSVLAKGANNCAQGGVLLNVGQDANSNSVLDSTEIQTSSAMCYPNQAPQLKVQSSLQPVVGSQYSLIVYGRDLDGNSITLNAVQTPTWLSVSSTRSNAIVLTGTAPAAVGDVSQVEISVTDGEATTSEIYQLTTRDGVAVSISSPTVAEGAQGELTPVSVDVQLSKALDADIHLTYRIGSDEMQLGRDYQLSNGVSANSSNYNPVNLTIPAGSTTATIDLKIVGNNQYNAPERVIYIDPNGFEYTGTQTVFMESAADVVVTDNDAIQLNVGQLNQVTLAEFPNSDIQLNNIVYNQPLPAGLSIKVNKYSSTCSDYYYSNSDLVDPITLQPLTQNCYSTNPSILLTGTPDTALDGTNAQLDVVFTIDRMYQYGDGFGGLVEKQSFTLSRNINFLGSDSDGDGTPDTTDAFPQNPLGATDTDNDGIGDEWELQQFGNLTDATATSDFDSKGYTDLEAFQNQLHALALKPIDFENGIPASIIQTGEAGWTLDTTQGSNSTSSLKAPSVINNQTGFKTTLDVVNGAIYYETNNGSSSVTVRVDGQSAYSQSGNYLGNGWVQWRVPVSNGVHTIEWQFYYYSNQGLAIDNIALEPGFTARRPIDLDGDGVLNSADLFPNDARYALDSDNDGIADEWENQYFNDLTTATATSDFDNDGLSDLNEFIQETNPQNTDSDFDGVAEGIDIAPNNGAYSTDSDNDGMADEWEITNFGSLTIADASTDNDGDGVLDIDEFKAGTPAALDSDGDGVGDVVDAFPNNAAYSQDTDGDGLADKWEKSFGGYYLDYFNPQGDNDGDGLTNLEEFNNGTNPKVKDFSVTLDYAEATAGQSATISVLDNDQQGDNGSLTVSAVTQPTVGSLVINADNTLTFTSAATDGGNQMVEVSVTDGSTTLSSPLVINIVSANTPTRVDVATGSSHSLMLMSDGSVYGWGKNANGQLGDGTTTNQTTPTLANISNVAAIYAVGDRSYVTLNDGTSWQLASNNQQLMMADGTTPLMNVQKIVGGTGLSSFPIVLDNQGNVYSLSFYDPIYYMTSYSNNASLVKDTDGTTDLTGISDIAAGSGHYLALRITGEVIAWNQSLYSSNQYGQLGNGTLTASTTPVAVSKLTNITQVYAAGYNSYAVDNLGDVYAWGYGYGIGDGNASIDRNVPVKVPNVANVTSLSVGSYATSGSVYAQTSAQPWVWGNTNNDHLLTYTHGSYLAKQITAYTPTQFWTGTGFSVFTENNTLFAVGANGQGQLGDGSLVSSSTPVKVVLSSDSVISGAQGENFEWGIIPPRWADNNWGITQNSADVVQGLNAVEVADALTDGQTATLEANVFTAVGPVSFQFKVSSEQDFDTLTFSIDGVVHATFSGERAWATFTFSNISAGQHKLTWAYSKDGGTSVGQDKAWIDDIRFPLDSDHDGVADGTDTAPYDATVQ